MRKIPLRKCVATFEQLPKKELLRIVRSKDGNVSIDLTGRQNGRGAYIKKSLDALKIAKKTKALEKALQCQIDESLYDEIEKVITQ
ncbi:TPA: YlxR family protein [bacterium]|jgi:predicted RNA-binding protein YlxR (DUF448 family)|nr:YlxR family protein [bacterium]